MQKETIEFFISFGYRDALEVIRNVLRTRDDVQILGKHLDEQLGCGEFYLRGSWDAYKEFLNLSMQPNHPELWFSIEHFEDDTV